MKKLISLLILSLISVALVAKEGMWPPFLFDQIKKDLRKAGLKLKVNELYDENKTSLKDAIVIFGGGCTGEVISKNGLVLTNHHCGYGTVQGLSSLENNYLLNGFYAKNLKEEIPCPGLKVTFIKSYEDVTEKVLMGTAGMNAAQKDSIIDANTSNILEPLKSDSAYEYKVSNFYQGNQYYLIKMEVYRDIRLVVFPPNGIGKFGGDTDNWAWPRHTGDFGLFRIYADNQNRAAEYSESNIPYQPKKFLDINVDGVKEGEFTMVYGFPGRTTEYISSAQVNSIMNVADPTRIDCRELKLNVWNQAMKDSKSDFVKYASKQARVANYWKKWKGEVLGLKSNRVLSIKQQKEKELRQWAEKNGESVSELDSLDRLMTESKELLVAYYFYIEALRGLELTEVCKWLRGIEKLQNENGNLDSLVEKTRAEAVNFYKNYNPDLDEKASALLLELYKNKVNEEYQIDFVKNIGKLDDAVQNSFKSTKLLTLESFNKLLDEFMTNKDFKLISKDEMYVVCKAIQDYHDEVLKEPIKEYNSKLADWNKQLMTHYFQSSSEDRVLFPDANSTLRLAYGKVEGVKPADGIEYEYTTTVDGLLPKYNPDVEEFKAPLDFMQKNLERNFGKYSVGGTVPVCFLASNHTTGGNSGSPVLNEKGQLIGLNFDRIWEGTMSDIYFDENICRNISVNLRYILYIIDQYGGSGWLLDEMNIIGRGF